MNAPPDIDLPGFRGWTHYNGHLAAVNELHPITGAAMLTDLFGFENVTNPSLVRTGVGATMDPITSYGYVMQGAVTIWDRENGAEGVVLKAGRWFSFPGALDLHLHPGTRVVVARSWGYTGLRGFGGPLEDRGRLCYIDGCSDTILAMPPVLGDPVLNHLHFPPGITQTMHNHPTVRCGAIASGAGACQTPDGTEALVPGMIWLIPAGSDHCFLTDDIDIGGDVLNVVAYHPDSDWGPTDDNHPMLNRTWVDGAALRSDSADVIR